MTLGEMRALVRLYLGSPGDTDTRFKTADINSWINAWGKKFINNVKYAIELIVYDTTLDSINYYSYPTLSRIRGIYRIEYRTSASGQYYKIPKRNFKHWDNETGYGRSSSTGHPKFWYLWGSSYWWVYPIPTTASSSADNCRIFNWGKWCKSDGTDLSDDSEEVGGLDDKAGAIICLGVASDGKKMEGKTEQSFTLLSQYTRERDEYKANLEIDDSEDIEAVRDQDEEDSDDTDTY